MLVGAMPAPGSELSSVERRSRVGMDLTNRAIRIMPTRQTPNSPNATRSVWTAPGGTSMTIVDAGCGGRTISQCCPGTSIINGGLVLVQAT